MAKGVFIFQVGNTMVPAVMTMRAKGYAVTSFWRDGEEHFAAEKDGNRFEAADPVAVLGLVAMYEVRGDALTPTDDEVDEFMRDYHPEEGDWEN